MTNDAVPDIDLNNPPINVFCLCFVHGRKDIYLAENIHPLPDKPGSVDDPVSEEDLRECTLLALMQKVYKERGIIEQADLGDAPRQLQVPEHVVDFWLCHLARFFDEGIAEARRREPKLYHTRPTPVDDQPELIKRCRERVLDDPAVVAKILRGEEIGPEVLGDLSGLDVGQEWVDLWLGFTIDQVRARPEM